MTELIIQRGRGAAFIFWQKTQRLSSPHRVPHNRINFFKTCNQAVIAFFMFDHDHIPKAFERPGKAHDPRHRRDHQRIACGANGEALALRAEIIGIIIANANGPLGRRARLSGLGDRDFAGFFEGRLPRELPRGQPFAVVLKFFHQVLEVLRFRRERLDGFLLLNIARARRKIKLLAFFHQGREVRVFFLEALRHSLCEIAFFLQLRLRRGQLLQLQAQRFGAFIEGGDHIPQQHRRLCGLERRARPRQQRLGRDAANPVESQHQLRQRLALLVKGARQLRLACLQLSRAVGDVRQLLLVLLDVTGDRDQFLLRALQAAFDLGNILALFFLALFALREVGLNGLQGLFLALRHGRSVGPDKVGRC